MKKIVLGILAHVDAGKTTMSEALLYKSGKIKTAGRVDHKDAYLDNHRIERERGITIFSKQALFSLGDFDVTLLDTPGHMDFSAEMERTLSVLDYAILVISGPQGVQAHTETLISLLERFSIPTFIWINKMDQCETPRGEIIAELQKRLGPGCVDFSSNDDIDERIAMCCEEALEEFLEKGELTENYRAALVNARRLFPCFFGSALKLAGTDEFIRGMTSLMREPRYPEKFGAKVFKITRDETGNRLTWLKVTGGSLSVRQVLEYEPQTEKIREEGEEPQKTLEKLTQIRFYSGPKYEPAETAPAGSVAAVTGLTGTYAGQGLGFEEDSPRAMLEPVFSYRILPPAGTDAQQAYRKISVLSEEDPMLRIVWNQRHQEINAQFMGEIQIEVLRQIIEDRFDLKVTIDQGRIMYRETIASPAEGAGHFEPLRHYAEVHLLLEPLPPGSGIFLESACSEDLLDRNWQRLILGNLASKQHVGVLTGSPLTDVKMTLIAGRAHLKHTEGGDFRQAALRAVRQGLMEAQNVLLEPYYAFRLRVPAEHIGRAVGDLKSMQADFVMGTETGEFMTVSGKASVAKMRGYITTLLSYTKGRGKLFCRLLGYYPCTDAERVVKEIGYDPERDVENTPDSVFCSHGAGVNIKWDLAKQLMHVETGLKIGKEGEIEAQAPKIRVKNLDLDEKELQQIMEKEFGKSKPPTLSAVSYDFGKDKRQIRADVQKDYYIVDGYNVIFAWDELSKIAQESLSLARAVLIDTLVQYQAYTGCELVLIFDGYKVKDNPGTTEDEGGIHVLYTKESETADAKIERLVHEIGRNYSVCVVSSDGLIQLSALRLGVRRMSSRELHHETKITKAKIDEIIGRTRESLPRLGERIAIPKDGRI